MKTKAEKFADFMAASRQPIAIGTVNRYLKENAIEITADVARFSDGSSILRADNSIAKHDIKTVTPRQGMRL